MAIDQLWAVIANSFLSFFHKRQNFNLAVAFDVNFQITLLVKIPGGLLNVLIHVFPLNPVDIRQGTLLKSSDLLSLGVISRSASNHVGYQIIPLFDQKERDILISIGHCST